MIMDSVGQIYCFRDIESSSYNRLNNMYTFNVSWENSKDPLEIYPNDIAVLYPETVDYYALGVNYKNNYVIETT